MKRLLTVFLLLAAIFGVEASGLFCRMCGRGISGNYLTNDKKEVFCSETCFSASLPRCAVCAKPLGQQSIFSNQRYFCSRECYQKQLPHCNNCNRAMTEFLQFQSCYGPAIFCEECAKHEPCFACMLPLDGRNLPDGRRICRRCERMALKDSAEIHRWFEQVQQLLEKKLDFQFDHAIHLKIVGPEELAKHAAPTSSPGQEVGVYEYNYTKTRERLPAADGSLREQDVATEENCTIYILDYLPLERVIEVFSHELTHDFLQHRYGNFKELKLQEGICEYAAARVNIQLKRQGQNQRFDQNPDPVYGDGYRQVKQYVEKNSWKKFLQYLDKQPRTLPPVRKNSAAGN